jgi:hypothetical protein
MEKKKLGFVQKKSNPRELRRKTNGTGKVIVCNHNDVNTTAGEESTMKKTALLKETTEEEETATQEKRKIGAEASCHAFVFLRV